MVCWGWPLALCKPVQNSPTIYCLFTQTLNFKATLEFHHTGNIPFRDSGKILSFPFVVWLSCVVVGFPPEESKQKRTDPQKKRCSVRKGKQTNKNRPWKDKGKNRPYKQTAGAADLGTLRTPSKPECWFDAMGEILQYWWQGEITMLVKMITCLRNAGEMKEIVDVFVDTMSDFNVPGSRP